MKQRKSTIEKKNKLVEKLVNCRQMLMKKNGKTKKKDL